VTIEYRYIRKAPPGVTEDGKLEGRAWPYNSVTMIGKEPWGFKEKIRAGAGKKSINDGDIVLLDNHDTAKPLARMSAGTLEMKDTKNGGDWEAQTTDTSYAQDVVKNVRAKNYGGCSFGFEVLKQLWTDDDGNPATPMDGTNREILEMKVHEISVCTFPAYTATKVSAREQVSSARGVEQERFAAAGLGELMAQSPHGDDSQGTLDSDNDYDDDEGDSEDDNDDPSFVGTGKTMTGGEFDRADDKKAPYGDVAYADPGYQADKKKRYPIDTKEHAKAAWSYINKAKNAAKYSAQQVASIKSKIKSALTKFGVKVSTASAELAEWESLSDFREMTEGYTVTTPLSEVDFGVMPGDVIRIGDANDLAVRIREAANAEERVACIGLAVDLDLAEMLPQHWGSAGEIGAIATDDVSRDMDEIYTLALALPATRTALAILDRAGPYLSETTRQSKGEDPEPEEASGEVLTVSLEDARQRMEEAQARYRENSRT
jgi:HK97 family phage prohead protease